MKTKVAYIADLDQDIDDIIAIEYLLKYDVLSYIVCSPEPISEEGKQRLNKLILKGVVASPEIQLGTEVIFCGGALTSVAKFIESGNTLDALVMNGGFVGYNIIKPEEQLLKFKLKEFVKTYNFNLDIESTKKVLSTSENEISEIILVGKHLCHHGKNTVAGLWDSLFFKELQREYKFDNGKRLHDVLACHEGLSLLNIIPDSTYCEYNNLQPMNIMDKWGSTFDELPYSKEGIDIYRECKVAVCYK